MRTLIAVSSCDRDAQNGFNAAMRQTWIREMPQVEGFDYKIFYGKGERALLTDEVRLDVPDDYHGLPFKTRESLKWALDQGYDFVFRAFTDTCISPHRLRTSGFARHHYFGCFPGGYSPEPDAKGHYAYASGGPGYFTDRKASEAIVAAEPDRKIYDAYWAEDLWVGDVLGKAGISGHNDVGFWFKWAGMATAAITVHLSRGTDNYNPQWMLECYEQMRMR